MRLTREASIVTVPAGRSDGANRDNDRAGLGRGSRQNSILIRIMSLHSIPFSNILSA